jgi:cytochrome P450
MKLTPLHPQAFVPRGTPVIASLSSAGKLSKYYGRYPGEFRPERFLGDEPANVTARHSWRPFGAGPRMCVGMLLGLSVVKAALAVLLQKFRVELENPSLELQGEPGPGGVLLPEADLKLVFIAREEERAL